MKRTKLLMVLVFYSLICWGQNISVTFTGTGAATQIDSIIATNLSTNQSVTLPGNETLLLTLNTGIPVISELTKNGIVFPNPFSGKTTFTTIAENPQNVYLKVHNMMGQVVSETKAFLQPGENKFEISLSHSGIYLVSITTDQGTESYKAICNYGTESKSRIQYDGWVSGVSNCPNQSGLKSSQSGYSLGYKYGDVIYYKCKSGPFTAISTDVFTDPPTASKNCLIEFTACTETDGKNYSSVKIGTQTWMAENLAYLPSVSPSSEGLGNGSFYYVYGYEGKDVNAAKATINYATYGVLYTWESAKTACPPDWHLPTDLDWKIMEKYLGMSDNDVNLTSDRKSGAVGSQLKENGTSHWLGFNTGASNLSGFNALPGGYRYYLGSPFYQGSFTMLGNYASFWSADVSGAWGRTLTHNSVGVDRYNREKMLGFSVRCLKNTTETASFPTVNTVSVIEISPSSATGGGNVTADGNASVTGKGICWSTSQNPTKNNAHTSDGTGTGSFTSSLYGLSDNTVYYVRAYATNSVGTSYGNQVGFKTYRGDGGGTFDYDGRTYRYKSIGTQIWMTENLAYLPSVSQSSSGSDTSPYYYVYGYEGSDVSAAKTTENYTLYGVLYNWQSAKTACPPGWHLPSDEEWWILEMNLGMSESDHFSGWRLTGAVGGQMKEAGTIHWDSPNTGANNSSGFNALPGGTRAINGGFNKLHTKAYFWSTYTNYEPTAYVRYLGNDFDGDGRENNYWRVGLSVRCVKNE
ncbi:MAG: T9SS type A sorting domain-containing protein [Bacteroidia bacterium]|nr:T9SS type A sorting domain-containing protein [Bacteroidia bacterium]